MDSRRRKLQAIRAKLGEPKQTAPKKGEFGFYCPGHPGTDGCDSKPQGKVRLWVSPDSDRFHCWHCGYAGGSLAPLMVRGSAEQREYLSERELASPRVIEERPPCTALPDGYTPFGLREAHHEAPYLSYLKGRGVSGRTVALYRMGYISDGQLAGRVVVPSFDRHGMINFWSARSIHPGETLMRYRLPHASKDIVSNEHMVDWDRPVYLVEGIFDEIAVGPQGIAVYGKFMQSKLALRLVERRPPMTYVCLDSDARGDAEELIERLTGYDLRCAIVDLKEKDPALAGRDLVERAASEAIPVSGSADILWARLRNM